MSEEIDDLIRHQQELRILTDRWTESNAENKRLREELAAAKKWQSAAIEAGKWREVERSRAEAAEAEVKRQQERMKDMARDGERGWAEARKAQAEAEKMREALAKIGTRCSFPTLPDGKPCGWCKPCLAIAALAPAPADGKESK